MKVALIGRPNVGKSSLFNRLVGRRAAIVSEESGVTRDRKIERADLFGLKFDLIDTAGVDCSTSNALAQLMNAQSFSAVEEADIILFVIDAALGVTEDDKSVADWIRKAFKKLGNKPIIVLKNKSDQVHCAPFVENLGFGEGIDISAIENFGMDDLFEQLRRYESSLNSMNDKKQDAIKIAIVGRPNVGKSTLINTIINEERLITGDIAGITRDAISVNWRFNNVNFVLTDTAGQRKQAKIQNNLEDASVLDAWWHIRQSHIILLVMDINNPLERQDISIARKAFDEGKIVIFVLSKSDTVSNAKEISEDIKRRIKKEFSQLPDAACLLISSKQKLGLARIFKTAIELMEIWSRRISTSFLNRWFACALAKHRPPLVNGMPIKLKYISQTNTRPPTFAILANRASHLPVSYLRYLSNDLRMTFKFHGVPIRIFIRQRKNPYANAD